MSLFRSFPSTFLSSSSRIPRDYEDPLVLNEDYQQVTSWYNNHRTYGPDTTIHTMQLRREHVAPFHQFIMLLTRSHLTYRVDRGGDGPVLDTMRDQGVPPRNVIAPLRLTSWKELDKTPYCMIESC